MTIFAKLGFAFGAVVTTFALTGALILWNLQQLRATDEHVRDRVSVNEVALAYRHAAQDATLGASQLAAGNGMGEQRVREGTAGMKRSRGLLKARLSSEAERRELSELERVERLTVAATERVLGSVRAKSPPLLLQQELAFLSARADALNLRLEALFDETREEVVGSTAQARAIGERVQAQTGYALLACVLFAVLVSALVFRSIAGPLARLDAGVRRIAAGNLEESIAVTSSDEIGQLTKAFNDMTAGLRRAISALDRRNSDMRVVLDHVNQGLLTMHRDGSVSSERSAMVEKWLGEIDAQLPLWQQLGKLDANLGSSFEVGWEAVLEDILPLDLALDQMPRRSVLAGRHLELEYRPIFQDGQIAQLLIVISDVSDRIARERAGEHEREVMAIFRAMQRDKQGFLDFVAEGTELLGALVKADAGADMIVLKRQVHTLKGNSSIFGIASIAGTCHELETKLEEDAARLPPEQVEQLQKRWEELGKTITSLAGDASTRIEIDDDEFTAILDAVVRGTPRPAIARMVANWRMERVQQRFSRLAEQARALAARLDKAPLQVRVEVEVARLPRNTFASFWSALVHALRNAVDHGIEAADERAGSGKPAHASLTLSARMIEEELAIEIADDGRGIDWPRIAARARERSLPADSEEDLVHALFCDGVSTAQTLSEVSGRGIGMAALRDACAKLAGRILIQSARGEGTRISFRFPQQVMSDETVVEICSLPIAASLPPRPASRRVSVSPSPY